MDQLAYYALEPALSNRELDTVPLAVNCTGIVSLTRDFSNTNPTGRRDFYLIYLIQGEMDLYVNGTYFHFEPGQFVLLPPKTPFRYNNKNHTEVNYYWVHFTGSDAGKLMDELKIPTCTPADISIQDHILRAFHRLFDEFIQPDSFFALSSSAHLVTLCTRFARAASGVRTENSKSWMLTKTLQYMNRHYKEDLTVSHLAGLTQVSCGYFRVLFREVTGTTPTEYLTSLRLKNACTLLYQTNLSIKEIAASVGFSDQLYFSRVFRKHYGTSPLAYRKENCSFSF